ncbi:unnamed protein product [Penicillium olsonii]|uniref:Uncharacterized protein n=1 Tax=Penicillium olsonii TaxID=99116 RepID=A0A9W4ICH8_PENOL|nr:unnamed protein product [Penicillium olsonii]CAG8255130.1 unnamed protein product [Penicillium olsonii]
MDNPTRHRAYRTVHLNRAISLSYQLRDYFSNPQRPHQHLNTTSLQDQTYYFVVKFDEPLLSARQWLSDWALESVKPLKKSIREFGKAVERCPAADIKSLPREPDNNNTEAEAEPELLFAASTATEPLVLTPIQRVFDTFRTPRFLAYREPQRSRSSSPAPLPPMSYGERHQSRAISPIQLPPFRVPTLHFPAPQENVESDWPSHSYGKQHQSQAASPIQPIPFQIPTWAVPRPSTPDVTSTPLRQMSESNGVAGNTGIGPGSNTAPLRHEGIGPDNNTVPPGQDAPEAEVEAPGFNPTQMRQLAQMIHEIMNTSTTGSERQGPPGPPGPQGPAGVPGENGQHGISAMPGRPSWKTDEVGYFAPDNTAKQHVRAYKGTTFYLNVYVFLNQVRSIVALKTDEVVRTNLQACLREAAQAWYSSELSEQDRLILRTFPCDSEFGWFTMLEKRFKPRAASAMAELMSSSYSWTDVRNALPASAWAQTVLRHAHAAGISGVTQQLQLAWTHLDPSLQRDIPEPSNGTTVAAFMAQLDQRYGQWFDMTRARRDRRTSNNDRSTPQRWPRDDARQGRDRRTYNSYPDRARPNNRGDRANNDRIGYRTNARNIQNDDNIRSNDQNDRANKGRDYRSPRERNTAYIADTNEEDQPEQIGQDEVLAGQVQADWERQYDQPYDECPPWDNQDPEDDDYDNDRDHGRPFREF